MKSLKNSLDYINVLYYLSTFALFLFFNSLDGENSPYSTALLTTVCALGANTVMASILYLTSFLIVGNTGLIASAGIATTIIFICTLIYRKTNFNKYYIFVLYCAVSLLGYMFIGNTITQTDFIKRIFVSGVTTLICFITLTAFRAISKKGLKQKLGFDEYATIAVTVALLGLGLSNLISPLLWKGLSVFILLIVCYLFRSGTSVLFSCVLGVSLAIYYANINYVSTFLILAIAAESIMPLSRHLSSALVCLADYAVYIIFGVYGAYTVWEFVSVISGCVAFCIIPTILLKKLKDKLHLFRDKHLVRQTINRNRLMLSNKLYELSGVFTEMSTAFNLFENNTLTEDSAKNAIQKQIKQTACLECDNKERCKNFNKVIDDGITKLIDIGFAKGRITLIDLPRGIAEKCVHPNNILYGLNKLFADYRTYQLDNQNVKNGRDMIAAEANGIAEILRMLALETGATLKYQNSVEKRLSENLYRAGFVVSEILIYGEEERICVSMIVCMKEFSHTTLQNIISKTLNKNMLLTEKADITEEKCYLAFTKAADYDAVFGIAQATKDGSEMSGDTHSVTRISGDRFLVALSDGMGSGEKAQSVSSVSLSLIETFYKAGLSAPLILNTVNKLLAINTEDSFSALDISVINLKNCTADFIKYGCPYGFIIGENGIRIVQGSSLPLGIIDDLKPSVCSSALSDGDVVLLLTDGVSDAFSSSGDILDFLRTLPAKNPQTLAEQVLEQAIKLSNGKKNDDMTALAVRVFKCSV